MKNTINKFWNEAEMMLKSFWTSHFQMMNGLKPLFYNWTGRQKGVSKGVDETHLGFELGPQISDLAIVCP